MASATPDRGSDLAGASDRAGHADPIGSAGPVGIDGAGDVDLGGRTDPSQRLFEATLAGKDGWGLTRADVAVAVGIVLVAVAAALALWFGYGVRGVPGVSDAGAAGSGAAEQGAGLSGAGDRAAGDTLYAVVQNTEGYRAVLPLDDDASVAVESDRGTNVIEVAGGRVRCAESDCSNQICVDTGWVSQVGQTIVCLPHELTVQVVADPDDAAPLV